MSLQQTLVTTVIPRSLSYGPDTRPVSVLVSPRLAGDTRLGRFPDWLAWPERVRRQGLKFRLRCAGQTLEVPVDVKPLRPDLWAALFKEDTLVRPYEFSDYSGHGAMSFSMRQSLSALKAIYQAAGFVLALPDEPGAGQREKQTNRRRLAQLVKGLDQHWDGREAKSLRARLRDGGLARLGASNGQRDDEGLVPFAPNEASLRAVAEPFSVFHHMPMPPAGADGKPGKALALDADTVLDFHQVLSSLNTYPELLRALGLVFDLELPKDFVKATAAGQYGRLAVIGSDFHWQLPTRMPELETAYVNLALGNDSLFGPAPRFLDAGVATPPPAVLGLLDLAPEHFGLAQVDVDGGLHKAIMAAESLNPATQPGYPQRNLDADSGPAEAPNPEIFDPEATLPALYSRGLQLYADRRGLGLLDQLKDSKAFNSAFEQGQPQPRPFFAEDLVRGYRLDIWDSRTKAWHSLHERDGRYRFDELAPGAPAFDPPPDEGYVQLGAAQPAPGAAPAEKDLYVHETIARWPGWSLSVPMPGLALSRYPDPGRAIPKPNDPDYASNEPVTPFKLRTEFRIVPGSLPRLRFGTRYRIRARVVDLAANSLRRDDPLATALSGSCALPRDPEGFAYLRFEPVAAPLPVLRDARALTDPGSAIDRLVIRSYNDDITKDGIAADTTAADRHLLPPRANVELGECHGLFDDAAGRLRADPATRALIAQRDAGEFASSPEILVAGQKKTFPLEPGARLDALPYLPDPLSRGAALRDLPGTASGTVGRVAPEDAAAGPVPYVALNDANPRPGSATLIGFGASGDWQQTVGFRFALAEPPAGADHPPPDWDPAQRLLTVYLPKGTTRVVPLSSVVTPDDLKLLGVWQWLREYFEFANLFDATPARLRPGEDRIAQVLQRAVEGGHWMLTPPRLLTLVHAVQQPLGRPAFTALHRDHDDSAWVADDALQTALVIGRRDPAELAPVTAWRRPGSTAAVLLGALKIHGASTAKTDLRADWSDPVDDPAQPMPGEITQSAPVDELPLPKPVEGYLRAPGPDAREVGYYDPEHEQIAFVRYGDRAADDDSGTWFRDAAPRQQFGDTRHHRVRYTATATSRYRDYFANPDTLDFTRTSEPVWVDVPASARPLAPDIAYVLPTFGWQRQTDTNLKRSVRFGGGLRVYLRRPWYSSGAGELLGVALWSGENGSYAPDAAARLKFKPYVTQWGMDPIWQTAPLREVPRLEHFPDAVATARDVSLEERSAASVDGKRPGYVDVAGHAVGFDAARGLWYADLTVDLGSATYAPFVRLALGRFQPQALADARLSRVVLAEFAQLTPERSALVTSDPHHPRTLRVVVSGVAPTGPQAQIRPVTHGQVPKRPTEIRVRLQGRDAALDSDLAWNDVPTEVAIVQALYDGRAPGNADLELWAGLVRFAQIPKPGAFRLLIEEFEYLSADYGVLEQDRRHPPGRLIYAETIALDDALVSET